MCVVSCVFRFACVSFRVCVVSCVGVYYIQPSHQLPLPRARYRQQTASWNKRTGCPNRSVSIYGRGYSSLQQQWDPVLICLV